MTKGEKIASLIGMTLGALSYTACCAPAYSTRRQAMEPVQYAPVPKPTPAERRSYDVRFSNTLEGVVEAEGPGPDDVSCEGGLCRKP